MKRIPGIKRNRIIIYYLLAIVVPSIFLGMLAFRGVKNDQALVEREQRRALQLAGQRINNTLDSSLKQIEYNLIQIIDSATLPENITFIDAALLSFIASNTLSQGAFYISEENDIAVLNNHLLYVPDQSLESIPLPLPIHVIHILENGWQMEFIQKDYEKAIDYYKNALPRINSLQGQAEIYNAIARLQKKQENYDDAIATYQVLMNSFTGVYIQGKIPIGMAAMLESGHLYLLVEDTAQCLVVIHALLDSLAKSRRQLNYPTYSNLLSKVKDIKVQTEKFTDESGTLRKNTEILWENISQLESRTAYLLSVTELAGVIRSSRSSGSGSGHGRFLLEREGRSYYVYLAPKKENGQWGMVYDQENLLREGIYPSVMTIADESVIGWKLVNNYGNLLIASEEFQPNENPVRVGFSSSLPPWTLVFYPKEGGLLASFIQSGQGVFFYIFLLIVIILALGLFFTLYVINNELSLSRMKSNFISTVTHEFKSPLTSIRQMAEMLEGDRVSEKDRQKKYYSSMVQESERLSHLIDNILDFSKMEAGQKNFFFEKANLNEVVEEMIHSCQTHLSDMGFQVDYILPEPVPYCFIDKEAIKQVLQNLMDNACKYSGDAKKIEVELTTNGKENIIKVRDFGIGIRKDEQEKIFSRFYRVGDVLTQKVKGSGIGLTIVKQIVEAHKGHMELISEPGEGSTFIVVLPLEGSSY